MLTPDGRRILIAWMENWATVNEAPRRHRWFGCMTMPRELFLQNGRLYQRPAREIEALWQNTISRRERLNGTAAYEGIAGRHADLTVTLDAAAAPTAAALPCALPRTNATPPNFAGRPPAANCCWTANRSGSRRDIPHIGGYPLPRRTAS